MASKSGKKTEPDLSAILEGLARADVRFILVGGLAAVVQGAPVTTMDVDIVHDRSSENVSKLFRFLESIDAVYRRPDEKIVLPNESDFTAMGHMLLSTRFGPLDILSFVENDKTYEDLVGHTVKVKFRGHSIQVLDLRTLVELKRSSNDPAERQRLTVLEETLRQLERKT